MVFSLVAYLFIKNRKSESFSLTTSEQYHFLQAVTKYSETADFIVDHQHTLKFANEHFLKMFDLEEEAVDNISFSQIGVPIELKNIVTMTGNNGSNSSVFTLNDGRKISCKKAPVTTHDGQHLGTLYKISDHIFTGKGKADAGKWLHEINTPLNAIVGYSEILKNQEGLNPDQRDYLETINAQSFQLKSRIEDLLADRNSTNISAVENRTEIRKVLIVDDVPINRTVLKIMLRRMDFDVTEAVNGKEALKKFEANPADLILMDISMPVMNGLETTKKLRQDGHNIDDLPIIAVTASTFYDKRETLRTKGFNALLKKPFKERDLVEVLKAVNAPLN
ncbi:response regulator [Rhodohalobacter halophilus]|uniref:response regulator n=1 Tax=Rhodohalobacter halophilus TaxID=1812810 RepID=UPI0015B536D3|nr:response regulator [Rhodohalobacter halophilus]